VSQFTYRETKYGTVFIERAGKVVTTLHGASAGRFMARVGAADAKGCQQLMVRAIGNTRHVSERGD
jgi:hypothetical protein